MVDEGTPKKVWGSLPSELPNPIQAAVSQVLQVLIMALQVTTSARSHSSKQPRTQEAHAPMVELKVTTDAWPLGCRDR